MKRILILLISSTLLFSSCSEWLDIKSDTKVVQDEMFSNGDGFRTALNGVYLLLSQPSLYSCELNYGTASILANNYKRSYLDYNYQPIMDGNYTNNNMLNLHVNPIWEQGYKVIANCNNLLSHVAEHDGSFFDEGQTEKDIIMGEAYGLRALMHFDLLRLFAPAPIVGDSKKYIPYQTVYPSTNPVYLSVNDVLDSVKTDLLRARKLMKDYDVANAAADMADDSRYFTYNRFNGTSLQSFLKARGLRMNYFAATALLARVSMYKGDKANALEYAKEVYAFAGGDATQKYFFFTKESNMPSNDPDWIYRKMYDDIILAFYNNKIWDALETNQPNWNPFTFQNLTVLFAGDEDDYRYSRLVDDEDGSLRWTRPNEKSASFEVQGALAPVIRASEIYYIMIECLAEQESTRAEAISLLNTVRMARGCKRELSENTDSESLLNTLRLDFYREYMTEGQAFYMYKRLNLPIFNGNSTIDATNRFVLPIPNSESNTL